MRGRRRDRAGAAYRASDNPSSGNGGNEPRQRRRSPESDGACADRDRMAPASAGLRPSIGRNRHRGPRQGASPSPMPTTTSSCCARTAADYISRWWSTTMTLRHAHHQGDITSTMLPQCDSRRCSGTIRSTPIPDSTGCGSQLSKRTGALGVHAYRDMGICRALFNICWARWATAMTKSSAVTRSPGSTSTSVNRFTLDIISRDLNCHISARPRRPAVLVVAERLGHRDTSLLVLACPSVRPRARLNLSPMAPVPVRPSRPLPMYYGAPDCSRSSRPCWRGSSGSGAAPGNMTGWKSIRRRDQAGVKSASWPSRPAR